MDNIDKHIKIARRWILESGIQAPKGMIDMNGQDMFGAFRSWYDLDKQEFSYIYTEISGYALTALLYLFEKNNIGAYLERAKMAGDWLLGTQAETGAFKTAYYTFEDSVKKPEAFVSFDIGMVCNGLANLYRGTNEEKYLFGARRAGDWLVAQQREDGSLPAQVNINDSSVKDASDTWSTQSGSYHGKAAIGLLNLFDIIKNEKYLNSAKALLEYALGYQRENGQFLTYGKLMGTHLHPHTYTAEGLYVAGIYLNDKIYLEASKRAVEWSIGVVKDALAPRFVHNDEYNYNERVDVLAQVLRLAILFNLDSAKGKLMLEKIISYQYSGKVAGQNGGFLFGKSSIGEKINHVNSWVTMFALQAMMIFRERELNPFYLI